jgi:uncharacterized iron-regulated membrane protein
MRRWWLGGHRRLHRWGSLVLGVLLLIECTSGAVLLFEREINQALHPDLYRETTGAAPLTVGDALRLVTREHPELAVTSVLRSGGVWVAAGPQESGLAAYVDAGAGRVNGVGPVSPWAVRLLANLHECGLTCRGYPGYQPWLAASLPGVFGAGQTVGGWLVGLSGALLVALAVSGAVLWWPGARRLAGTLRVRWRRPGPSRHRDLHRTVGILSLPFLFMWGWTGAAFVFDWPAQAYFAVLPGHAPADPRPTTPGAGPPVPLEQAESIALRLHPGAEVTGLGLPTPGFPTTYLLRLRSGPDPYAYSAFPGNHPVGVDRMGGGVIDYAPETPGRPLTERWWRDGTYNGVHFGTVVPGLPRLVWLVFGLSPLLLGVTGTVLWLTGRRGTRNRRRARRAAAAPPRPPVRGRPPTRPSPGGG